MSFKSKKKKNTEEPCALLTNTRRAQTSGKYRNACVKINSICTSVLYVSREKAVRK